MEIVNSLSPPAVILSAELNVLTSSPRLSRRLVTGLLAHGIWLSLVFGHSGVYAPIQPSATQFLDFTVYPTGRCQVGLATGRPWGEDESLQSTCHLPKQW
jgi:hypothetical protein